MSLNEPAGETGDIIYYPERRVDQVRRFEYCGKEQLRSLGIEFLMKRTIALNRTLGATLSSINPKYSDT
jgi:hypothetical protein